MEFRRVLFRSVRRIAEHGFGRGVAFIENYDPSLPSVMGSSDQLIQVFLNLAKNAAEAIGQRPGGEIIFTTAYRPDRKRVVEGKSVSVRVDLGGRRIIKKKKQKHASNTRW